MAITEYFIRYLSRRDQLTPRDRERLGAMRTESAGYGPGEVIVPAGKNVRRSCMMLRGMAARSHDLSGRIEERVITALHVPGDFVDLHGFVLTRLEHAVISLGHTEVEFVDHSELIEITEDYPHLTRLLWMSTAIDAAIHRQWLVAAASLRSSSHLAHLLCEIYTRLQSVGAAANNSFQVPLLQRELAQVLGYSPIHVNRAVRDLRERGLVRWSGTEVEILNWEVLVTLARFDPAYLNFEMVNR